MGVRASRLTFWVLFVGMLVIDQLVKLAMRANFSIGQSRTLIPGVLDLNLQYNEGIAFGKLQGFGIYLAPIAIVIAVGAIVFTYKHPQESGWAHASMGLLASGALGNMIDRVVLGRVTDMFETRFVKFPVFNVADSCITLAAAILIVKWGLEGLVRKDAPQDEPSEPPAGPPTYPEVS
jgi:signal peptidase II